MTIDKGKPQADLTAPMLDPAHDVLRHGRHPLDRLFAPRNVAVIGATEKPGSVGRTLVWNLVSSPFGGTVFPVNPHRKSVLGIKAYPDVKAIGEKIDLAVIAVPAGNVPEIVGQCVDKGVPGAIILSAGFKESGPQGVQLEQQILAQARRGGMRVIGPNCLGLMCPNSGLNATFASTMARPGNVGFISQSGALCTAVLDWSLKELVGFSAFVSIGSMLDVGWGDLIDYLGNDPHTHSILIYMESIGDARAFLSAAREVALHKPIIVLKAGRTEAAAKAAASHTGSLTGSDEVLEAAFRRCGALRVNTIADLFYMAEVLAKQPRPKGPRLAIITNAGGPGVLAADMIAEVGGELAELSEPSKAKLDAFLPSHWSRSNPIDILGDADPARYASTLKTLSEDSAVDGFLVVLTPQAMTDPTRTAEQLKPYAQIFEKPVLASWMGGAEIQAGKDILNRVNIPTFEYPDTAAKVFAYMAKYSYNLRGLYETPVLPAMDAQGPDRTRAAQIVETAGKAGHMLLDEQQSKELLAAYGIPVVATAVAANKAQAVQLSQKLGYPVVLKVHSDTITHKTDVGGVTLNLRDARAVENAFDAIEASVQAKAGKAHFLGVTVQPYIGTGGYELILGSSIDAQFGPVLLFGAGGQMVEILKDHALALPPLNTTLARRMMERTKIFKALQGVRGRKPADLAALAEILVRFSYLVVEQRLVREIDINPLLVCEDKIVALDARVILHDPALSRESLPRPAIRPYPLKYVSDATLHDGTGVTIRPIRPEDEPLMAQFHRTLSEQSVYFRYFHHLKLDQRVAHERLTRVCFNDYDREIALVAERKPPATGGAGEIIAVGRLSKLPGTGQAELAVLVSDRYQRQGLGTELMRRLLHVACQEKLSCVRAQMLPDNIGMQKIFQRLGFEIGRNVDDAVITARMDKIA